jgi:hypothetical protein
MIPSNLKNLDFVALRNTLALLVQNLNDEEKTCLTKIDFEKRSSLFGQKT